LEYITIIITTTTTATTGTTGTIIIVTFEVQPLSGRLRAAGAVENIQLD
jgi:hypothetical protein